MISETLVLYLGKLKIVNFTQLSVKKKRVTQFIIGFFVIIIMSLYMNYLVKMKYQILLMK